MRSAAALTLFAVAAALTGCGGTAGGPASSSTPANVPLVVLAASSLSEAFLSGAASLESSAGIQATFSFQGSQQLVTAVENGAPGDVVATADSVTMQKLVDAGLVEAPHRFARNRLAIAVGPGNPRGIHELADLARPGAVVVLADPSVPAGRYAAQALASAGVSVTPRSLELSVRAALAKVESGDADASIVYLTDVTAAGSRGAGVAIPDAVNVVATYPIAVIRATARHGAAQAFVDAVLSGSIQLALRSRGFLAPA